MSHSEDLKKILDRLPLTENEKEVYLALLSHGPLSGSEISDITGIERYTVYTMLGRLNDKGFVDVPPKRRASKYKAVPPQDAILELQSALEKRHKEQQVELEESYNTEKIELNQIGALLSKLDVKEEKLIGTKPSDLIWLINSEARIKNSIIELLKKSQKSLIVCLPTLETSTYKQTRQEILVELQSVLKKRKTKLYLTLNWELEAGTADEEIANTLTKYGGNVYQWAIGELPFAAFLSDNSQGLIVLQSALLPVPKFGLALWIRHPDYVKPFEKLIERFNEAGAFKKWG